LRTDGVEEIDIAYCSWEVGNCWNEYVSTWDFKPVKGDCCSS